MSKKNAYVALHTIITHDPDIGQETFKAGQVIRSLDEKEIPRLLAKRAIRPVVVGEEKQSTAPLVPGIDDDDMVGDTSDHSDEAPPEPAADAEPEGDDDGFDEAAGTNADTAEPSTQSKPQRAAKSTNKRK